MLLSPHVAAVGAVMVPPTTRSHPVAASSPGVQDKLAALKAKMNTPENG